ncbi:T9SS type A sorting domain-containing protein [Aestuariibaculum marinum]|uniref:T9SS type A sorting domain-containing protein n=1 Tax=Aestuariibaculum marinum TaxID=2683592 RepID=A0A8J6PQR9_9FLAO|nr:T9SS type A sorting domain-containing protein [Aestuariibaculum marinum]MBD0822682.1 T9SS type A sorting domain-containing protein [Aestuariibaculum marinum]
MRTLLLVAVFCYSTLTFSQSPFGPKQTINSNTGATPRVIASGLIDNDNYIDIVIGTSSGNTIEWYKNNGNGTFSLQTLVSSNLPKVYGLAIADLDKDSDNDIVATSNSGERLVWFQNDGNGNFSSEKLISSGLQEAFTVKVADIDGNNTMDVVVSAPVSNLVAWYSNDGSGNFGNANIISSITSGPRDFDLGDYDKDGDLDIVIAYKYNYAAKLFNNNLSQTGSVSFTAEANNVSSGNLLIQDIAFGDVDNDGYLEIVKLNTTTNPAYYKKQNDGSFTETILTTSNQSPSATAIADIDNDSKKDVIVGYSSGNANDQLTLYKSSNPSSETLIDGSQNDIYSITVNDFDNDGDLDIATISLAENHLNWFENTTVSKSLSVKNTDVTAIQIYPNPSKNKLNFNNFNDTNSSISIYDILGHLVMNTRLQDKNTLDVSTLNKGMYLLKFNEIGTVIKFIKN